MIRRLMHLVGATIRDAETWEKAAAVVRTVVDAGEDIMQLKRPNRGSARDDFHAYAQGVQPYNTMHREPGAGAGAPGLVQMPR